MDKQLERIDDMAEYRNVKINETEYRNSNYGRSDHGNLGSGECRTEQDIEALIALLDGRTEAGDSRIKVDVVEGEGEVIARQYHHGRCDVGSPWACGTPFDVLE